MTRLHLFNRRAAHSFNVDHFDPLAGPDVSLRYYITVGQFPDGSTGEVFIAPQGNAGKGSMLEAIARDAAILMSLALQHGAPIETMRKAMTRDEQNRPQTFVGAVLDGLEG